MQDPSNSMTQKIFPLLAGLLSLPAFAFEILRMSTSRKEPYWIVLAVAVCGLLWLLFGGTAPSQKQSKPRLWPLWAGSVLFAFLATLANYPGWLLPGSGTTPAVVYWGPLFLWVLGSLGAGGFALWMLFQVLDGIHRLVHQSQKKKPPVKGFFPVCFAVLFLFFLAGWLLLFQPGLAYESELAKISAIQSGLWKPGLPLFPDLLTWLVAQFAPLWNGTSAQILAISILLQMAALSAAMALAFKTVLRRIGSIWPVVLAILLMMLIYVYWIIGSLLSSYVWLGTFSLIWISGLLQKLYKMPHSPYARLWLIVGGAGISLCSAYGAWYLCFFALLFLVLFGWRRPSLAGLVLVISLVCSAVVWSTDQFAILKTDHLAAFSLPVQQFGRTAASKRSLTGESAKTIGMLIPITQLQETYTPDDAAPLLTLMEKNKTTQLAWSHPMSLLKAWVSTALHYPLDFLLAATDVHGGYWNGGYDGPRLPSSSQSQEAIFPSLLSNKAKSLFRHVQTLTDKYLVFLVSMGFQFWMVLALILYGIRQHQLSWAAGLWVAICLLGSSLSAPSARLYALSIPLFLCMPVVWLSVLMSLGHPVQEETEESEQPRPISRSKKARLEKRTLNGIPLGK